MFCPSGVAVPDVKHSTVSISSHSNVLKSAKRERNMSVNVSSIVTSLVDAFFL